MALPVLVLVLCTALASCSGTRLDHAHVPDVTCTSADCVNKEVPTALQPPKDLPLNAVSAQSQHESANELRNCNSPGYLDTLIQQAGDAMTKIASTLPPSCLQNQPTQVLVASVPTAAPQSSQSSGSSLYVAPQSPPPPLLSVAPIRQPAGLYVAPHMPPPPLLDVSPIRQASGMPPGSGSPAALYIAPSTPPPPLLDVSPIRQTSAMPPSSPSSSPASGGSPPSGVTLATTAPVPVAVAANPNVAIIASPAAPAAATSLPAVKGVSVKQA